jgi:DNA helicase TIP49 (TBP-interacting protein)
MILKIRADVEGIEITEDALKFFAELGVSTSLRFVISFHLSIVSFS